jgi:WD40 repeat protein
VPDAAAEKQARSVAWQLYGADYNAAKTAASRSELAQRLLGESDNAKGDPASRYAMLRIVIDMAGASGDAETALDAADRLIDEFDVEVVPEKLAVLTTLADSSRQAEQRHAIAKAAFALLDVAVMEEHFETAQVIFSLGRTAALKARRADLAKAFDVRQPRIESIGKANREFLAAKKGLESAPADPAYNLAVGRYLCFARGEWNSGIPHLAKAGDAALKALAERELSDSNDEQRARALGDDWWQAAEGREPWEQDAVHHRAAVWYGQVPAEQRTGLIKLQIEKRLEQVLAIPKPWEPGATSGVPTSGRVTLRLRNSWKGHEARVFFTEFSPDGRLLATGGGSEDRLIRFWDVASGQLVRTFAGYTSWTPRAAFSPDGTLFASAGGWEKSVRIAQVTPGEQLRTLEGHTARVRSVAFTADGKKLLSCGDDRTVRLWDPNSGELLKTLTPHAAMVTNLVVSTDGSKMATCSPDKTIKIWDVAALRVLKIIQAGAEWPWKVAFSPDGKFLATTFGEGKASLWDVESGERRWVTSPTEDEQSQAVAFSPDGRWILVAGQATYYIFDSLQGRELARFQAHPDVARCANFSPDGKTLATSGDDGLIKLWDVETWTPARSESTEGGKE